MLAAILIVTAAYLAFVSPTPARAANLPGSITDVFITETSAPSYGSVTVNVDFALPPSAATGDTFTLQLPPSLVAMTDGFDLLDPHGVVVATAVVHGGVVTFTVSNFVDTHDGVTGTAHFGAFFNTDLITLGSNQEFTFIGSGKTFHDHVQIGTSPGVNRSKPRKYGFWTDPVDQGTSTLTDAGKWRIESARGPWDSLTFTDGVGAGQAFDCATLRIVSSKATDSQGRLTATHPLGSRAHVTCSATAFVISIGAVASGEIVQVTIAATITDPTLTTYPNSVTVTTNNSKSVVIPAKLIRFSAGGNGNGTIRTSTAPTSTAPSTTAASTSAAQTSAAHSSAASSAHTTTVNSFLPTQESRTPTTSAAAQQLPNTGSNSGPLLGVAAALLGLGGTLLALSRRRRGLYQA